MDLATLRSNAEALSRELAKRRLALARGAFVSLAETVAPYAPELSVEAYELVVEARARAKEKGEERRERRLGMLARHLLELAAMSDAARAHDAMARVELASTAGGTAPGELLALRTARRTIARTAKREARASLDARVAEAMSSADDAALRTIDARQEAARRRDFSESHASLAAEAQTFLAATDAMYFDVLAWWLKRLELKPHPQGAERHDVEFAFGPPAFEGLFPKGNPTIALTSHVGVMGLDSNVVRFDVDDTATRTDVAEALAIDPPDEVWVVARRGSGLVDTRAFLAAFGEALSLSGTDAARPFEDRFAGDEAVPKSVGDLFAHWLLDARWLAKRLDAAHPDLVRVVALFELARARRACAKLLHEVELCESGAAHRAAERYAERMSLATGAKEPATYFLEGLATPFRSAVELRSLALAHRLFEGVRDRFDEDWWANPRTGAWLAQLFEAGRFDDADLVAKKLGLEPPSLAAFARRMETLAG